MAQGRSRKRRSRSRARSKSSKTQRGGSVKIAAAITQAAPPEQVQAKAVPEPKNVFDDISAITKAGGTLLAGFVGLTSLFYVLGFVIVNLYLLSLGVRDLEFGKPAYLSAGLGFMTINGLSVLMGMGAMRILASSRRRQPQLAQSGSLAGRFPSVLRIAVPFLVTTIIAILLLDMVSQPEKVVDQYQQPIAASWEQAFDLNKLREMLPWNVQWIRYAAILGGITMFAAMAIEMPESLVRLSRITHDPGSAGQASYSPLRRFGMYLFSGAAIAAISMVAIWSMTIYPKFSPAFGGGRPAHVRLVINETKNIAKIRLIGLNVDKDGLSSEVRIADEGSKAFTVLLDNGSAARIDRSHIAHILFLNKNKNAKPASNEGSAPAEAGGKDKPKN